MTGHAAAAGTDWTPQVWGDTAVLFTSTAPTSRGRELAARELNDHLHIATGQSGCRPGRGLAHVVDWIHAFESVLVQIDPAAVDPADLIDPVLALLNQHRPLVEHDADGPALETRRRRRVFDVPAVFDTTMAPDLDDVAAELTTSREVVVASLVSEPLRVGCVGVNMVPLLTLPAPSGAVRRLPSPRTRVAAGSIALAGTKAVVCTGEGPSGWRVVARTPLHLFDVTADPMSSYVAGDLFRIRPIPSGQWDHYTGQFLRAEDAHDTGGQA